jgi:hypothetical protein
MEGATVVILAIVLFALVLGPFLVIQWRRGKALGRGASWCKPRGHGDVGADTGRGRGGRDTPGPTAVSDECLDVGESARPKPTDPRRRPA